MNDLPFVMWVIYHNPRDFPPGAYVARPWRNDKHPDGDTYLMADTLEKVRAMLPPGLTCLLRMPGDDPVIVEVWV